MRTQDTIALSVLLMSILLVFQVESAAAVDARLLIAPTGERVAGLFGHSVACAGDVNGDGYDDVIVGAPRLVSRGRAYIYLGGRQYGSQSLDETPDFVFTGEADYDDFGWSVAGAGDVNGDGCDDVVIGAPRSDVGGANAGRAYVFFMGLIADAVPDLTLSGGGGDAWFGQAVAGAGDMNGDGFDDVVIGAPRAHSLLGMVFVLAGPDGAVELVVEGKRYDGVGEELGTSVACAGHWNGDDLDDIVVGAPNNCADYILGGRAYIYYGGSTTTCDTLTANSFREGLGASVAPPGDFDGDGRRDLVVGAPRYGFEDSLEIGRAYLYLEHNAAGHKLSPSSHLQNGLPVDDNFGFAVAGAGDLNGDHVADVVVSSRNNESGTGSRGRVFFYLGGGELDLVLNGQEAGEFFGYSLASVGDVNNDGYDEVIVGAPYNDVGGVNCGRVYVYRLVPRCGEETGSFGVTSLVPDAAGDHGSVVMTVMGCGLESGCAVAFMRPGQEEKALQEIALHGSGELSGCFTLDGLAQGLWDLEVRHPDGRIALLPEALLIEEGVRPRLSISVLGRSQMRPNVPITLDLACRNDGNEDAYGVSLFIDGFPADASLEVASPLVVPPAYPGEPEGHWYNEEEFPFLLPAGEGRFAELLIPRIPAGGLAVAGLRPTFPTGPHIHLNVSLHQNECSYCEGEPALRVLDLGGPPRSPGGSCAEALFGLMNQLLGTFSPAGGCIGGVASAFFEEMTAINQQVQSGSGLGDAIRNMGNLPMFYVQAFGAMAEAGGECALGAIPGIGDAWSAYEWARTGEALASDCGADGIGDYFGEIVSSIDPNCKSGPTGIGTARYISGMLTPSYQVMFENLAEATAPAAHVVVADSLDGSVFALGSARFTLFHVGSRIIPVVPEVRHFEDTLDLRPDMPLLLAIWADVDTTSGLVLVDLASLDPDTGLPPEDPLLGFLPPNIAPPDGEGSVAYSVGLVGGLPTGTMVANRAEIRFDTNPPITTATWTNQVDGDPPETRIGDLPGTLDSLSVPLQVNGGDAGSGLRNVEIWVSVDEAPFAYWRTVSTANVVFEADHGGAYAFYSVGRDSCGNVETAPAVPDAVTRIESAGVPHVDGQEEFGLSAASPSFGGARLTFAVPDHAAGLVEVFDVTGREIMRREVRGKGTCEVGSRSARIDSGIHFVRLRCGEREVCRRVVILK